MSCSNCGQTFKNSGCGCEEEPSGVVNICQPSLFVPIEVLPSPQYGSRKYIYILPSNQLYVLDYEGTGWLELDIAAPVVKEVI